MLVLNDDLIDSPKYISVIREMVLKTENTKQLHLHLHLYRNVICKLYLSRRDGARGENEQLQYEYNMQGSFITNDLGSLSKKRCIFLKSLLSTTVVYYRIIMG